MDAQTDVHQRLYHMAMQHMKAQDRDPFPELMAKAQITFMPHTNTCVPPGPRPMHLHLPAPAPLPCPGGGGGFRHHPPPRPLKDWAKFSSGPLANPNFSLAPILDQNFSSPAPKTQHHLRGGEGAGWTPPPLPLHVRLSGGVFRLFLSLVCPVSPHVKAPTAHCQTVLARGFGGDAMHCPAPPPPQPTPTQSEPTPPNPIPSHRTRWTAL